MSVRPRGFKTQEDYNAYMRAYKKKRRVNYKMLQKGNRVNFLEWEVARLNKCLATSLK